MTKNEWYTPSKYIEMARAVMGRIDLDPASCKFANETVKADHYYTKEDNGLMQPWYGNVWLNPPFSKTDGKSIGNWARRIVSEYQDGNVKQAILLSPSSTEVSWFQPFWNYPICFKYKRMDYYCAAAQPLSTHQSRFGTCFVYLGSNEQRFIDTFSQFGRVARAVDTPGSKPININLWQTESGVVA